jgi:hypothetical protein
MNTPSRVYPGFAFKGYKIKKGMPVNDEGQASKWLNVSCSAGMRNPGML